MWTREELAQLAELSGSGLSLGHIAHELGRSKGGVKYGLKLLGLPAAPRKDRSALTGDRPWTDDERSRLRALRREGISLRLAAVKLARGQRELKRELERLGMSTS